MKYHCATYRLSAGALQLTIFIGVLVALILSAFLLYFHTAQTLRTRGFLLEDTIRLARDGARYTTTDDRTGQNGDLGYPGLQGYQTLKVESRYWGAFEWVKSTATGKKYTFEQNALLGGTYTKGQRPSVYLANTHSPLVVVGSTKISGDAHLSEYGIKAGNMGGEYFHGKKLLDGDIIRQDNEKLSLPEAFSDNLYFWCREALPPGRAALFEGPFFHNSFKGPTKWVYEPTPIDLGGSHYSGNIIIRSESGIRVPSSSYLEGVILIAPEIQIGPGFKGTLQAFATRSIRVGDNVRLGYPSALTVSPDKGAIRGGATATNQLRLGKNVSVKGCLYFMGSGENPKNEPHIFIGPGSRLTGEIFCRGDTEIKGSVIGSVFTRGFVAREFGSLYRNHLYNATIDARGLPDIYAGMPTNGGKKGIAQWLY